MENIMSKRNVRKYRKIYKDHYKCSDDEMSGKDVHHIDENKDNNDPLNLELLTPKEHAEKHKNDFILWARKGSKLGNEAFIKRLREQGPTKKELENRKKCSIRAKQGLHQTPHSEKTKIKISKNKKEHFKNKTNHPMWGKTTYKIISPNGDIFIISGGWKEWCFERNLVPSNLRQVALGNRKQHKGWIASII